MISIKIISKECLKTLYSFDYLFIYGKEIEMLEEKRQSSMGK